MLIPLALFLILLGLTSIWLRPNPGLLTSDEKARLFEQAARKTYPLRIIIVGIILGTFFLFTKLFALHSLAPFCLLLTALLGNRAVFAWLNFQKIDSLRINPAYVARLKQASLVQTGLLVLFFAYILVDLAFKLHRL